MTIQEKADNYVGHTEEVEEDLSVSMTRNAYKDGALNVVDEIQSILTELHIQGTTLFAWGYIQAKLNELKGNGKD